MDPIAQNPVNLASPLNEGLVTSSRTFGPTDSEGLAMFQVSAGVVAEDALVQASHALKCAYETAYELTDNGEARTGLVWTVLELLSSARALVDAVAEGMNAQGR